MTTEDIIKLLESGNKGKAKKAIIEYIEQIKLSPAEEARILLDISSVFMKANSDIARAYQTILEEVSEEFRDLNLKEKILTPRQ
ncbi:MAG: hypothetical protein AAB389_02800 [Patescibacteria group bacterium]